MLLLPLLGGIGSLELPIILLLALAAGGVVRYARAARRAKSPDDVIRDAVAERRDRPVLGAALSRVELSERPERFDVDPIDEASKSIRASRATGVIPCGSTLPEPASEGRTTVDEGPLNCGCGLRRHL